MSIDIKFRYDASQLAPDNAASVAPQAGSSSHGTNTSTPAVKQNPAAVNPTTPQPQAGHRLQDFRANPNFSEHWSNSIWEKAARAPVSHALEDWKSELQEHPDRDLVEWFLHSLEFGFMIGVSKPDATPPDPIPKNHASAQEFPDVVANWLDGESKGGRVVGPFDDQPSPSDGSESFTSPLGLIQKVEGGKRRTTNDCTDGGVNPLILDETARVNYPTIESIAAKFATCQGGYAVVADVRAAFRNLPICREDLRFCCFRDLRGKFWVDTRVCFGGRTGPGLYELFAKLLQWIILRHIARWGLVVSERLLDDSCFVFRTLSDAVRGLATIKMVCAILHVDLADDKFQLSQSPTFLGYIWDLLALLLLLPPGKLERLDQKLLLWSSLKAGDQIMLIELMKLIGYLEHVSMVISAGRPFMRRLQRALSGFGRGVSSRQAHFTPVRVSSGMLEDIAFWCQLRRPSALSPAVAPPCLHFWLVRNRRSPVSALAARLAPWTNTMATDASPSGFGGFCSTSYFSDTWLVGNDGTQLLKATSTTFTEFLAVLFALRLYGPLYTGSAVRVFCDNAGVVQDWLSQSSPDSAPVQAVIRELTLLTTHLSIFLIITWIPTAANRLPDYLSRQGTVPRDPTLDVCLEPLRRRSVVPLAWREEAWALSRGAATPAKTT